eukprot:12258943-Alexandrium_andersonii.AAC.1
MPSPSSSADSSSCNLSINSTSSMSWRALRPRSRPSDRRSLRSNSRPGPWSQGSARRLPKLVSSLQCCSTSASRPPRLPCVPR